MGIEIERKFLVKGDFEPFITMEKKIKQSYLSSVPERTVRVRIKGDKGFITIKGIENASGASRYEWEKEIAVEDAESLLKICEPGGIEKQRFIIPEKSGLYFEVDVFYGENEGLVIAEIELPSEDYQFIVPPWLGKEVTGDERFYNASLSVNPYCKWK